MKWDIEYYETENGKKPARDFLKSLPDKIRAKSYGEIIL
jgi:hypothetical protein